MVNKFISKGKQILISPQSTILSAATVIMLMIVASRVLGLVRQRALAYYFTAEELSLFFSAFRLPDLIFEILVFGTFTSAFIPVFTRVLKDSDKEAWKLAASIVNLGLVLFAFAAILIGIFAEPVYTFLTPGFNPVEQQVVVQLSRILFLAQGFFVISYVLAGSLESIKRFTIPAMAPIFYNLGIIAVTILFSEKWGLFAPTLGVFLGAFLHFAVQLPFAYKFGFRFSRETIIDANVKKIGKLAAPKVVEVAFLQISKTVELFLASLVSTASYTYFTFGNTLQLLPVGLFGVSIAKAALPTLSDEADSMDKFTHTLWKTLYEMVFLILPFTAIFIVLDIPIVRLVYGTEIFSWESTVQTGAVLTAFAAGIVFQAVNALLARAFYALQDTRTPVIVSISSIVLIIILDFIFIKYFSLSTWGLAAAFSIGSCFQSVTLFYLISKKINGGVEMKMITPFIKFASAAFASGLVMYILLKFFDRSVWVKRLSFLINIETIKDLNFESFVLDTRYTMNVLILTILVAGVGILVYVLLSILLDAKEVWTFINLGKRIITKHKIGRLSDKEEEPLSPPTSDVSG
jgi:putative peptidoglycan lipid II flippase